MAKMMKNIDLYGLLGGSKQILIETNFTRYDFITPKNAQNVNISIKKLAMETPAFQKTLNSKTLT